MDSPATLEKFKKLSKAYTLKATKSRSSAIRTLQGEGILTRSGRLTKVYR